MPRVKQFDREDVLNKAIVLFWEQGFHATSVQDLVSRLGINRASLYDTFGDKETLFKMALNHYRERNLISIRKALFSTPIIREGLLQFFDSILHQSLQLSGAKGCFIVNSTTELLPGNADMQAFLLQNKNDFEKLFLEYLQQGETEGQFPKGKDLKALASLLFTLQNGIQVVGKVSPDHQSLMQNVGTALSLLD